MNLSKLRNILLVIHCATMANLARAEGTAAIKGMTTAATEGALSFIEILNPLVYLYWFWMLFCVLVAIALERQGHKEMSKDITVGLGMLAIPSVLKLIVAAFNSDVGAHLHF